MDELAIEIFRPPGYEIDNGEEFCLHWPKACVLINGCDLLELVRQAEVQMILAENRTPSIEVGYQYPIAFWYGNPHYWFNTSWPHYDDNEIPGKRLIFCCFCGEVACGSVAVRITTHGDIVTWAEFEHNRRRHWKYESLGPFVFDRRQYARALYEASLAMWR